MSDMEKVIKGLEYHLKELSVGKTCFECPYHGDNPCEIQLIANALALLKEQDAVEPIAKEDDTYECICGAIVGWDELDASGIVHTQFNYCPFCGKPVLWEGR